MGRLFGTDGVRGVANSELTPELAFKLGQAGAYVLTKEKHHKAKILVGRDTRISGHMLEAALVAGICSVGAEAVLLGVVPTPAVAYLTKKYNADAGVVISASHNPVEYNGIKFFNNKGYKLRDELEEEIEGIILDETEKCPTPTGEEIGTIITQYEAVEDYIEYTKNTIKTDLKGLKVAIDCANGAASVTAEKALKALGANVHVIHSEPNGKNINKNCGSTHMDDLIQIVKDGDFHAGIAFDGDADRCLAVDEKGNYIDGDQIMAICADLMKEEGTLKNDTIVATVMSNLGLHLMGKEKGITIETTQVGDRYVLEDMLKNGHNIGGEQSGHVILLDYNTTGDGLLTALHLLEVLVKRQKPLSELASVMRVLPQVLENAKVDNSKKYDFHKDVTIKAAIHKIEEKYKDEGRVLIRPSGTEPLVRVMLEGIDQAVLEQDAKELASLVEKVLG
ncbi:phosphoglucosamine mutase [Vallitalea okinawensis]|uniref:phosphoglucosamine mutase n=1 Tax=Vallitalea okinawensis TaxID=2078660 RepID=UPI000CFE274F|nr:phosphoglucosamine mutase [Vallitalea okinawensis]